MKIIVTSKDGETKTIELSGTIRLRPGDLQDKLSDDTRDYFFTKQGFYDGWGMMVRSEPKPTNVH